MAYNFYFWHFCCNCLIEVPTVVTLWKIEAPRYFNWRPQPQKWPKLKNKQNPIIQTNPGLQLLLLPFLPIRPPWGTYCSKSGWPRVNKGTPGARILGSNLAKNLIPVKWGNPAKFQLPGSAGVDFYKEQTYKHTNIHTFYFIY